MKRDRRGLTSMRYASRQLSPAVHASGSAATASFPVPAPFPREGIDWPREFAAQYLAICTFLKDALPFLLQSTLGVIKAAQTQLDPLFLNPP
jgi:hypothetical protein